MKKDWQLFKRLISHHSGLGWNDLTKTVDADDDWWDDRIQENKAYKKFRNKDLYIYWFSYDSLFADVVATGNRARVPSQRSTIGLELNDDFDDEDHADDGKEGSGDSDDNTLFPSSSKSSGSKRKQSEKTSSSKKKKSGAEQVKEGINTLVAAMTCKSTCTTGASNDPTLDEAIEILDAMTDGTFSELYEGSDLYYFGQQYILNKGNTTLFLKDRSNQIRYGQLQYNRNVRNNRNGRM